MKKSKKFTLNGFLSNNKVLFIVSVLISLTIWIYMSYGTSNDTNVTVSGIPIQIELSDEAMNAGLMIFSGQEQTASVTVTGNRATLGAIKESDITVTAAANTIDSAGDYSLPVSAAKTNPTSTFQITSAVVPSSIKVAVDYFRETSFQLQENVVYKVADGYYASTTLSAKTINVSGPQTEISKIDRIAAVAEIGGTLTDSVTVDTDIVVYDKDGNELDTDLLTMDTTKVKATVSVLPEKTVTVNPVFTNKPSGLNITDEMLSVKPSTILLAGPKSILEKTESVNLQAIDFSTLKNDEVTFESLGIDIPSDCKNISNSTTAKVTLNLSALDSKTFDVEHITVKGLSDKYKSEVTQQSIKVTVIGPKSNLEDMEASSITAIIDTTDSNGKTGSVQMPVTFTFSDSDKCWAYGEYNANLTITEK